MPLTKDFDADDFLPPTLARLSLQAPRSEDVGVDLTLDADKPKDLKKLLANFKFSVPDDTILKIFSPK
jgi:hypothetical protein